MHTDTCGAFGRIQKMKTIKQLADEMGISKQALNKRIDNLK